MKRIAFVIGAAAALFTGAAPHAMAATVVTPPALETPAPPQTELSVSSNNGLRIGYQSPIASGFSLGAPLVGRRAFGGFGVANAQDVSARFSTQLLGGDIGFFGGYADQPSTLALSPASSWNFGATLGYAGVYVLGGVTETSAFGPFLGREGWAAGFGYEIGAVDLRLTYAAEASDFATLRHAADTQQITLGGIYTFSPRFRLNADAFYSGRPQGGIFLSAPTAKPPQGTGARVGVQLRF